MDASQVSVVLLDIEGTVAPIRFVHEVLFGYARAHIRDYLSTYWESPGVQSDVALLRQLAEEDLASGVPGAVSIARDGEGVERVQESIWQSISWQMDHDRKSTALKSLQGRVWREGYESGQLKSEIYVDVPPALRRWRDAGIRLFIYSSGSVSAQKLFFGYSDKGDLTELLAGYFDTRIGHKREVNSYRLIAEAAEVDPRRVLFITDVVAEALAAEAAQMQAIVSDRPGNPSQPAHSFPVVQSFDVL